jgi:hypothetical protein
MNESYNAMIVNDTESNNVSLVITTDQLVSMQYLFNNFFTSQQRKLHP